MATYVFRCPEGHITERQQSMRDDVPESIACRFTDGHDGSGHCGCCFERASRVFLPPAAIHYKGPGTYTTDYKLKYERRRRKNAGDDLPVRDAA